MLGSLAKEIVGSANDRRLKIYAGSIYTINTLQPQIVMLSDKAFRARAEGARVAVNGTGSHDASATRAPAVRKAAKAA